MRLLAFAVMLSAMLALAGCGRNVDFVSKSKDCFGSSITVNGRYFGMVEGTHDVIPVRLGWNKVSVSKPGYTGDKLRFWVESDESTEGIMIKLYANTSSQRLKLFMYGQQGPPKD